MFAVKMSKKRKIIHIDMDAFYASIEQRDHPDLKGFPVVVGGERERGVIAAASYEARKYGIRSAMSSKVAKQKCPELIFRAPDFKKYKQVSNEIREIFYQYTDLVEPLSLDEAFLDVTESKIERNSATLIAMEIKQKIKSQLDLTASAGVSYNKFLAKIASDINKPDGIFVITPEKAHDFIDKLEIRKFFGIGKITSKKLNDLGIFYGSDLKLVTKNELIRLFGKAGSYYYDVVRGIDERPVMPDRERKSVGVENTFEKDLLQKELLNTEVEKLVGELWRRLERTGKKGKTLTLKIKFSDFEQITRSSTRANFYLTKDDILKSALDLMSSEFPLPKSIRLLGLTVSNFFIENSDPVQLVLDFI